MMKPRALLSLALLCGLTSVHSADFMPSVSAPPAEFFELVREKHRDKARGFY